MLLNQISFNVGETVKEVIKRCKKKRTNRRKNKDSNIGQISLFDLSLKATKNNEHIIKPSNQINLFDNSTDNKSNFENHSENTAAVNNSIFKSLQKNIADTSENYVISKNEFGKGKSSDKTKCLDNIVAIESLKNIENSGNIASKEEQKKLVKYTGWGKLAQSIFSGVKKEWEGAANRIKSLLTDKEYKDAEKSSLTAFYTPISVIKFIYSILDRMGFTGGRILEPSCGIGNFFGCLPKKLQSRIRCTGVELDTITAKIAKLLYPKNKILNKGFENTDFEESSFDLIIGNVPFGNYNIFDKKYNKYRFKIHNYFFAKSLDLVRPGGIIAFVTSHFTMDSKDESVRKYINQRADLLGAVRLPNKIFGDTETLSDIIFLQKREIISSKDSSWLHIAKNQDGIIVNQYYIEHPEMIAGKLQLSKNTNQYGKYDVIVKASADTDKTLNSIIKYFPLNIYEEIEDDSSYLFDDSEKISADSYPSVKDNAFVIINEKIYQRHRNSMIPVIVSTSDEKRIKHLLKLKEALQEVIDVQIESSDDSKLFTAQSNLDSVYNYFYRDYGCVNSRENRRVFDEDPSYALISSIENVAADGAITKADIFSKRTISPERKITHCDTIDDALIMSLNTSLSVDFNLMSKLTGKSQAEIKDYLIEKQLIFKNPETELFETSSKYLSGKVVDKLEAAKEVEANNSEEYKYNVSALLKVQPTPIDYTDIKLRLGSSWIPAKYIRQFVIELLNIDRKLNDSVSLSFIKEMALWKLSIKCYINNYLNSNKYGTNRINAVNLIEMTLNLKTPTVKDRKYDAIRGKDIYKVNKKETLLARQKQSDIQNAFLDWIWRDIKRRNDLVSIYNKTFNSTVVRKYDGSKLVLHGISATAPKARDYQLNAIMRELCSPTTLLAHCVGSGKTYEMVAAGIEMKRLGVCHKPMYVVPNSLVESGQFAREFLQLYPTANILVATSKDFTKDKRRRFISRICTGDWDAVIIGHSSFEFIPVSRDTKENFLDEQILEYKEIIQEFGSERSQTVKAVKKAIENLSYKLKILLSSPKDNIITFEKLGVDQLFIDEAHNFKNLGLITKMTRVAGVPTISSQKAEDLYLKIRYLLKKNDYKHGVVFATGTPISNTIAELYVMQKYLMYDRLEEVGFETFDAWASTFGEIISSIEINPTGTGYRSNQRFAKFNNVPELMKLFREVADIITADMIDLPKPKLQDGKITIVKAPMNPELKDYVQSLVDRAEKIHNGSVDPSKDNMLCVVNDGKKAALDPRLVGINVDYPDSKINLCVDNVYSEWVEGMPEKLTQIIFCDLGTPKKQNRNKTTSELLDNTSFNVYEDIKRKLINKGIPAYQIVFIHDADTAQKKSKLFQQFREGKIRILIGSTGKMGEGCNIQDRLAAMHELDCPWRPSDVEQREGRILRVGNMNSTVRIYRYCTKGTFDNYSWQTVETKAKFIAQVMSGRSKARSIEDVDANVMSFAEMKAACSENPLIAEKIKTDMEIQKLQTLRSGFTKQQNEAKSKMEYNQNTIEEYSKFIKNCSQDLIILKNNCSNKFTMKIGNDIYTEHETVDGNINTGMTDAGECILNKINQLDLEDKAEIGEYNGLHFLVRKYKHWDEIRREVVFIGSNKQEYTIDVDDASALGIIRRIENKIDISGFEYDIEKAKARVINLKKELEGYKEQLNKSFSLDYELKGLLKRQTEINLKLNLDFNQISNTDNEVSEDSDISEKCV